MSKIKLLLLLFATVFSSANMLAQSDSAGLFSYKINMKIDPSTKVYKTGNSGTYDMTQTKFNVSVAVTITDTTGVTSVKIEFGNNENGDNLFSEELDLNGVGLPAGVTLVVDSGTYIFSIGKYSDIAQYGSSVRLKFMDGTFSAVTTSNHEN